MCEKKRIEAITGYNLTEVEREVNEFLEYLDDNCHDPDEIQMLCNIIQTKDGILYTYTIVYIDWHDNAERI